MSVGVQSSAPSAGGLQGGDPMPRQPLQDSRGQVSVALSTLAAPQPGLGWLIRNIKQLSTPDSLLPLPKISFLRRDPKEHLVWSPSLRLEAF